MRSVSVSVNHIVSCLWFAIGAEVTSDTGLKASKIDDFMYAVSTESDVKQIIDAVDLGRECRHLLCTFSAARKSLEEHEKRCQQRPVPCPIGFCEDDDIPLSKLIDHLRERHPDTYFGTITSPIYTAV